MPHVIVKMFPGRTEEQKKKLALEISNSMISIIGCEEKSISIAVEEVNPSEWDDKVYKKDILGKENSLYKKPGYGS